MDAVPYATIDDLESRWRPLGEDEKERATTLLLDGSRIIDTLLGHVVSESKSDVAKYVVCNMVKRVMIVPLDQASLTSEQRTAGPYSEMLNFANPTGDMYLTSAEKKMLGISGMSIGTILPAIHDSSGGDVNGW